MDAPAEQKKISCKRCQKRKIRCSRTEPCINCKHDGQVCEYRQDDDKRGPLSREYVSALETHIASIEGLLMKLKTTPSEGRDLLLRDLDFAHSQSHRTAQDAISGRACISLQQNNDGIHIFHGVTSIYQQSLSSPSGPAILNSPVSPLPENGMPLKSSVVSQCLALFFHWQYPQMMFIDREAFLVAYLSPSQTGYSSSSALIHSMCAIGALFSHDIEVRKLSDDFSKSAQTALQAFDLNNPHLTMIQAHLTCAFYEIGKGDFSKSWIYSGIAFRMAQDLGLHHSPSKWVEKYGKQPGPLDSELRIRLYMGCYISDKNFSLFLGRPPALFGQDSDIELSTPKLQYPIWDNWLEENGLDHLQDFRPLIPKWSAVFNQQFSLAKIIEQVLALSNNPHRSLNSSASLDVSINALNRQLLDWFECLTGDMKIDKWSPLSERLVPNVATLHLTYHIARLSLNRPSTKFGTTTNSSSLILNESIETIINIMQRYKTQHGLPNAPLTFVHAAILAVDGCLTKASVAGSTPAATINDIQILDSALQDLSQPWELAAQARNRIKYVVL